MTKRITTTGSHHYKVRVVLPGALIHLASAEAPTVHLDADGRIRAVGAQWLSDPDQGDTLGYIDWSAVTAVTWRWTGAS